MNNGEVGYFHSLTLAVICRHNLYDNGKINISIKSIKGYLW